MRNGERGYLSRPMHLVEAVILLGMTRPVPQLLWLLAQAPPDAEEVSKRIKEMLEKEVGASPR